MRGVIASLVFLAALTASAELKKVTDFYSESEQQYKKAQSEKTFAARAKILRELESSLEGTLQEYEKKNPREAEKDEKEVSLFHSTLEAAYDIAHQKTADQKDCAKKRQSVLTGDSMGRGESAPLTKPAQETLRWIDLLCK